MCTKDHITNEQLLKVYEQRSTCSRMQVAAVIVKEGRVIASGWNGVPPGAKHCDDHFNQRFLEVGHHSNFHEEHGQFSLHNEVHAETNAIGFAAKHGIATADADLYCTFTPCLPCAKQIQAAGIKAVYYTNVYDRDPDGGINFLKKHGIPAIKLSELIPTP